VLFVCVVFCVCVWFCCVLFVWGVWGGVCVVCVWCVCVVFVYVWCACVYVCVWCVCVYVRLIVQVVCAYGVCERVWVFLVCSVWLCVGVFGGCVCVVCVCACDCSFCVCMCVCVCVCVVCIHKCMKYCTNN
jgi:hypothetical protein